MSGASTPTTSLSRFKMSFQTLTKSHSSGEKSETYLFEELLKSVHKDCAVDLDALELFLARTDPCVCQTPEVTASSAKSKSKLKLFVSLFRDDYISRRINRKQCVVKQPISQRIQSAAIDPLTPISATFDGLLSKTGLIGLRTGVVDTNSVAYGTLRGHSSTTTSPSGNGAPFPPPMLIPLPESPGSPSESSLAASSAAPVMPTSPIYTTAASKPGIDRHESFTGSFRGSVNGTFPSPSTLRTGQTTLGRLTLITSNPPPPSRADPNRSNSTLQVKCHECNSITAGVPAVQFLQMTISAHESNQLELSLHYLRHAQEADPSLALAPFLEGIYLRHGWGCTPDLPKAYLCLYRALRLAMDQFKVQVRVASAASANTPLGPRPSLKPPADASKYRGSPTPLPHPPFELSNAKSMVALVLYEVSASHRFGWGVAKQRVYAHQIMELAANMGDMDACINVGMHAIKHGNKRRAAKYLRWASYGGWTDFGTGWIFKDKYDDPNGEY
ncbi:hypothetical protein BCR44DRAFT_1495745 [Catenaria anguillulae PL171]|uniref:HCP-like protein n=1 Tax=Catenaria anguillulae PL171 TaxID=765915 RepID=A0A1Y2I0G5_9FUNG|nr:hypothetical protein BCR44DRAFT_1495745 [Catenaria anguillulae PL171]